ncbi:MAG: hypothetical protein HYU86_02630 [Chloroflexi bacterium]|nr:hypothetical protein [Chloroflexota bacterium]
MGYQPLDFRRIKTVPLASRESKVDIEHFAQVGRPGESFSRFLQRLPRILAAEDLNRVVAAVLAACKRKKPVIWGLGAHVIKCGLSPLIIQLMEQGAVTAVAMNGAGAIHDVEIALAGKTSEDVAAGLEEGLFGTAEETGRFISEAVAGGQEGNGMGKALGQRLVQIEAPYRHLSILARGAELEIPITVHVAIGTDITHIHPTAQGEPLGAASFYDFRLLAGIVAHLGQGGVYLNVGSAVLLPEVFLKALSAARNLGHRVSHFSTVNMDMIQHYRPRENVVRRPTQGSGHGYAITGHHEIMIPLLAQAILEELSS